MSAPRHVDVLTVGAVRVVRRHAELAASWCSGDHQRACFDETRARPPSDAANQRHRAQFLTRPVEREGETRVFLRDPDGHLFELSEPT